MYCGLKFGGHHCRRLSEIGVDKKYFYLKFCEVIYLFI